MLSQYCLATPEIYLGSLIVVVLLVDLFIKQSKHVLTHWLTVVGVVAGFVLTLPLLSLKMNAVGFDGLFKLDHFAVLSTLVIWVIGFAVIVYARTYLQTRQIYQGEFYLLILTAMLGALILVSANSLLTLYLGLELMSLPLYALIAIQRDSLKGPEGAMKYFVMGSVASGILLFGMTLIYAVAKSIFLPNIMEAFFHFTANPGITLVPMVMGLLFMVIAIVFKLSAVPFHMWAPDVYEGAPLPVTAFISTIPKIAVVVMFIHLIIQNLGVGLSHLFVLRVVEVIAILSLLIGNIFAVVQTNLKRLMAYSTIAHVGFVLLALSLGQIGESSALFYVMIYVLMSVGGFGALTLLGRQGKEVELTADLKGLAKTNAFVAFMLMLLLLSMAGVPPFIGFIAKLKVIMLLVDHQAIGLAIFAMIMSVVGAYYYLRVIKSMYFDEPQALQSLQACEQSAAKSVGCVWDGYGLLFINGLAVLVLGFFPAVLLRLVS